MDTSHLKLSKSNQIPTLIHYYQRYLGDRGYFVEVGAYDGESWSNTSGLADLGWTGLYLEPVIEYAQACLARHLRNNVKIHNIAVAKPGISEVTLCVQHSLSSTTQASSEMYQQMEWSRSVPVEAIRKVSSATLDQLLEFYSVPLGFDLLVVDIEGGEKDCFLGFSVERYKPKMIICELCDYTSEEAKFPEIVNNSRWVRERINHTGYAQVYADNINTIFVLRDLL
jgi:FkbM family methyltransferase